MKDATSAHLSLTKAGRLQFIIELTRRELVVDAYGDPITDDFGELVYSDPIVELSPQDIIEILDL